MSLTYLLRLGPHVASWHLYAEVAEIGKSCVSLVCKVTNEGAHRVFRRLYLEVVVASDP